MLLRRVSIVSVLVLSLGGAVALASQNPLFPQAVAQNPGEPSHAGRGQPKLMDQLNLTADQKQKLQAIRSQYKDQISQRKQAVRQASQELRDLMAGTASADQIRTKHQQLQQLRQQLEEVTFESTLASREVLTPDQRKQLAQLMEQRQHNSRKPRTNQTGSQS
jgi:Spy/CpxP family protein refolding chaperone